MKAYTKLSSVLLSKRQKGDKSLKTLELTAKMVVVNPDFYTIWGYRREILAHHYVILRLPPPKVTTAAARRAQNLLLWKV